MLLNFSPDHLDRHADVEAYARGQGADLRQPDGRRLGGAERGRPGGASRWRGRARAAAAVLRSTARSPTASSSTAMRSCGATRQARAAAACRCRPSSCSAATCWPTCSRRRPSASLAGVDAGRDDARGRGFHGPRARAGAGGRDRRRAVRQRLEGHQHRRGATRDRELRRGLVAIMGGRFKGGDFGDLVEPLRRARRAVVAIGEARAADARCARGPRRRCTRRRTWRAAVRTAFALASPGGRGAARAGVLELRHVRATTRSAGACSSEEVRRLERSARCGA